MSSHHSTAYLGVHSGAKVLYVLVEEREAFDAIPLAANDLGSKGKQYGAGRLLTKTIEAGDLAIVFQFWIERPATRGLTAEGLPS